MNPTSIQIEAIEKLINAGLSRAASVLNTLLKSPIRFEVSFIKMLPHTELIGALDGFGRSRISGVEMTFNGKMSGNLTVVFKKDAATALVSALTGDEMVDLEVETIWQGTLCEVGNIVLNAVIGSIANLLNLQFVYSVPSYIEDTPERLFSAQPSDPDASILLVRTQFSVDELSVGEDIVLFIKVTVINQLLKAAELLISDSKSDQPWTT